MATSSRFGGLLVLTCLSSLTVGAQPDSILVNQLLDKAYPLEATDPDAALSLYHRARKTSERINYPLGTFKALQYTGIVHNDQGRYDSALFYYRLAGPAARRANYRRGEATTAINTANTYQFMANYRQAVAHYLIGIRIFEQLADSAALSQSYQNLSALYTTLQDTTSELKYLKLAVRFAPAAAADQRAMLYGDIGLTQLKQDRSADAFPNFRKSADLASHSPNKRLQFIVLRNWGDYYRHTGQPRQAAVYYKNAEHLGAGTAIERNDLLYLLSILFLQLRQADQALEYARRSSMMADTLEANELRYKSYKSLADIHAYLDLQDSAYSYLARAMALKDTVMQANYLKEISSIQGRYESERKDRTIAEHENRLRQQELALTKKEQQAVIWIGLVLLISLLSSGLWYFSRQRQRVGKLEALMSGEENERSRIAQELHDGVNGELAAIKFRLSAMEERTIPESGNFHFLRETIEMVDHSCRQIRNISHNLSPTVLHDFGLLETLRNYCSTIRSSGPLALEFQHFGEPKAMPLKAETAIYRIIQELVTNITKHANATEALVQFNFHRTELAITIEDNGKGFDVDATHAGIGLKNVQSRIRFLHATLEAKSGPSGSSFLITIDLTRLAND